MEKKDVVEPAAEPLSQDDATRPDETRPDLTMQQHMESLNVDMKWLEELALDSDVTGKASGSEGTAM